MTQWATPSCRAAAPARCATHCRVAPHAQRRAHFVTAGTHLQVTRMLVGDDSGARLQMEVPLAQEHSEIRVRKVCGRMAPALRADRPVAAQPGDEVELVVVSDEPQLQRFRAVREAYLPELGLWLSEYPFVERRAFRAVSDAIAAAREQTEEAGWR